MMINRRRSQMNEYEIKKRATDEVVQQKLVEDEAKKQGTSVDKLFAQFDNLKEKDVEKLLVLLHVSKDMDNWAWAWTLDNS